VKCENPKQPANNQSCRNNSEHDFISLYLDAKLNHPYCHAHLADLRLRVSERNVCSLKDTASATPAMASILNGQPVASNIAIDFLFQPTVN
jgi:hypothetical protein